MEQIWIIAPLSASDTAVGRPLPSAVEAGGHDSGKNGFKTLRAHTGIQESQLLEEARCALNTIARIVVIVTPMTDREITDMKPVSACESCIASYWHHFNII